MRDAAAAVDAVRHACWREQALRMRYVDEAGARSERDIRPLAIVYTDRALTVLAWCCLRVAFRMFRIERIVSVESTGTSFRPRRVALLRAYLAELRSRDPRPEPRLELRRDVNARRPPPRRRPPP